MRSKAKKRRELLETTALPPAASSEAESSETEVPAPNVGGTPLIEASDDCTPLAAQIELPDKTGPPDSPANDLLVGASRISEFLFGTARKRRAVYHLAEKGVLPGFKWGGQLVARKSTLLTFIADRERTALANLAAE